jgi:hypothetical protein
MLAMAAYAVSYAAVSWKRLIDADGILDMRLDLCLRFYAAMAAVFVGDFDLIL